MIKIMDDLPVDTLGIAMKGKVTEEDYKDVLIPAAEKKLAEQGKIKLLARIDEFDGMELAAMWQDTKFGLKHWSDFSHLALVTDIDWIKSMTAFFAPLVPGEVRMYSTDHEDQAREWLTGAQSKAA